MVQVLDGIMKLDMQPIEDWMRSPDNILFDESDMPFDVLGVITFLWGRSETFLQFMIFQIMKDMGDKSKYNPTRKSRYRLLLKIGKYFEAHGTPQDKQIIDLMFQNLKVTQLVRTCVCHNNVVGVLKKPEKAILFEGFDRHGSIQSYVITTEMIEGTVLELNMAIRYMQAYAAVHYPGASWINGG